MGIRQMINIKYKPTPELQRKALMLFYSHISNMREICGTSIDLYDAQIKKVKSSDIKQKGAYNLAINIMSCFGINQIKPTDYSTTELPNGVIMTTICDKPLNQIYKEYFKESYETALMDLIMNKGKEV